MVIGVREDGDKEFLAVEVGYRESEDSWSAVFRDLRDRGMNEPKLMTGDGSKFKDGIKIADTTTTDEKVAAWCFTFHPRHLTIARVDARARDLLVRRHQAQHLPGPYGRPAICRCGAWLPTRLR